MIEDKFPIELYVVNMFCDHEGEYHMIALKNYVDDEQILAVYKLDETEIETGLRK